MSENDVSDGSVIDVAIVGGGVAGRTAAIFTARHGMDTLVIDAGGSLLRRNAHLENVPGFPAGVNPRQFLDLLKEQVERAGARWHVDSVDLVEQEEEGFLVRTESGEQIHAGRVIIATKNDVSFVRHLDGIGVIERGKTFLDVDSRGRTGVSGIYAAGRIAEKPHQTAVCAGHGAEVAITILEEDDRPFYHDWVAPTGYFSGRGRDIPPGCEEIDAEERLQRENDSLEVIQDRFEEIHPDRQENHPRVSE